MSSQRLRWSDLPDPVRAEVEDLLGARVVGAHTEAGGYSPSLASRCRLDDGRRVFVKSCSSEQNPDTPWIMRREAAVTGALPRDFPAPALIGSVDDGHWVTLVFEEVDGRPPREPWDGDELRMVLTAVERLAQLSDPSPIVDLDPVGVVLARQFSGWRTLASGEVPSSGLDDWSRRHAERLAAIEATWTEHASGDALLHRDIRGDNVLVDRAERVWFVDWPWACLGASWLDLAFMLPAVEVGGGPRPEEIWAGSRYAHTVPEEALTAIAVALAGLFTEHALRPPPPGLPTVRAFQAVQGAAARRWVRARTGFA